MLIAVFPLTPLLAIDFWRARPGAARSSGALRGAAAAALGALVASPLIAVGKAWYGRDPEDREPRQEAALAPRPQFWRACDAAAVALRRGSFRYDNAARVLQP